MKLIKRIEERQEFWWNHLLKNVVVPEGFDKTKPAAEFCFRFTSRNIATSWMDRVRYRMHKMVFRDNNCGGIDNIVAHEVCHCFAERLVYRSKHGSLWVYLVQTVCGFKDESETQKGPYLREAIPQVNAIGKLYKLRNKIKVLQGN